jgi:hypothetical protein
MVCQQWVAVISSISRLFSVTISDSVFRHGVYLWWQLLVCDPMLSLDWFLCLRRYAKAFEDKEV